MQALGNCNQPYASRAPQNFQPNESLGNANGLIGAGRWNPQNYTALIPAAGTGNVYLPGQGGYTYNGGNYTNTGGTINNYDGNQFFFPTNQAFNINNYYGGSTFNVGGNSTFNNLTTNNITTNTITVIGGGGGGGQGPPGEPGTPGSGGGFTGGQPGSPGWGGPVLLPPVWTGPFGPPIGNIPRPPFTGTITVRIPSGGKLKDDCSVELTGLRGVAHTVSVR